MSEPAPIADIRILIAMHERLGQHAAACLAVLRMDPSRFGDAIAPELLAEVHDAIIQELRTTQGSHQRLGLVIRAIMTAQREHLRVDERLNRLATTTMPG